MTGYTVSEANYAYLTHLTLIMLREAGNEIHSSSS